MGNKIFKVCIVDDNKDYLFTMETFLSRNGFDVVTASDGQAGIELIKDQCPDLIVLDIMMETTFSGFEVCRQVRNDSELKEIPIIGVSGMADELGIKFAKYEDEDYFRPNIFLDKPVDKTVLLAKIYDLIS